MMRRPPPRGTTGTHRRRRRGRPGGGPAIVVIVAVVLTFGFGMVFLLAGGRSTPTPPTPDSGTSSEPTDRAAVADRPVARPVEPSPTAPVAPAVRQTPPARVDAPAPVPAATATALTPPFALESGSFEVPTRVDKNPTVTCHWVRPTAVDGLRPPRADDVVMFMHYPDERDYWVPATNRDKEFHTLAKTYGFTVMGLWFARQGVADIDHLDPANRSKVYMYPESGSADAEVAAHDRLVQELGLPKTPVFCFGNSGGAIQAQLFLAYQPDLVDAVAGHGGIDYARYLSRKRTRPGPAAACFTWTAGDTCEHINERTSQLYAALGLSVTAVQTPLAWGARGHPEQLNHHVANRETIGLLMQWLAGVSDLRRSRHGVMPERDAYPFHAEAPYAWPMCAPNAAIRDGVSRYPPPLRQIIWQGRKLACAMPGSGTGDRTGLVIVSRPQYGREAPHLKPDSDAEWDIRGYAERGFTAVHVPTDVPIADVTGMRKSLPGNPSGRIFLDVDDPTPEACRRWATSAEIGGMIVTVRAGMSAESLGALALGMLRAGKPLVIALELEDRTRQADLAWAAMGARTTLSDEKPAAIARFAVLEPDPPSVASGRDRQQIMQAALNMFR